MNQFNDDYFKSSTVPKLEAKDLIIKSPTEISKKTVDRSFGGRETVRFKF